MITDQLDSRVLRFTDCYAQRFMKPGTYRYGVVAAGVHPDHPAAADTTRALRRGPASAPFTVQVEEGTEPGGTMGQTVLTVRREGNRFLVDQPTVRVRAGDMVLWHGTDASWPFAVAGEKEFFGSDRLVNESGFSHAFTAAGTHEWADAYGSHLRGTVRVRQPRLGTAKDVEAWQSRMSAGTLVTITDAVAEPAEVDLVVGQTVFFVVTRGPGVSVTDVALLPTGGTSAGDKDDDRPHRGAAGA